MYGKKLGNVKMVADLTYVVIALVINLFTWLFARENFALSVGINSVASVLLTGRFVNLTFKLFPGLRMDPLFKVEVRA